MAPMEFIKGPLPQPCVATPGSSDMMRPGMTLPPALGMSAWEDGEEAGFGSVGSINQMPWAKLIRDHTSLSSSATAAPSIEVWPASWVQTTFVIRGGVGRLNDGNTFSTQKFVPSFTPPRGSFIPISTSFFCFQFFYDKCLRRNLGRVRWGLEGHSDMNSGIEELTILDRYFSWPGAWVHGWPWMAFGMVSAGLPRCSTLSQGECFSWLQSSLGKGIFSKGISQHVLDSAWHGLWFGRHFRIYCIQVSHPNARKSISVFAARISKKKSSQNEEIKLIGPSVVHQILLPCPYGAGLSKICTWRCCSNLGGRWMWMWRAKHFFERPSNLFLPFPTRL